MPSNFQQWNPTQANQENDAAYTADSLRSGGAPANAICPSITDNKFRYQTSAFIAAFAAALSAKGYSVLDTVFATLQSTLANIVTFADMTFANIVAALGFTPVQQGTGVNQNNTIVKIGQDTGDINHARMSLGVTDLGQLAMVGKDTLAVQSNNYRIQWGGPVGGGVVVFPIAFSGAPVVVLGNISGSVNLSSAPGNGGFTLVVTPGSTACWIAIGPK